MASINKLSIRGVRAFSPDDEEQCVEFYFPLTIITGANGCGKTTIIESLKFALSGSLPPSGNARSAGQSFVHDPRSIGQTSVKAQVKLRFTNKAGSSMVVIRSMEVQQKKTTMSFKQLDGIIRAIDTETGERVSLSHKCGELDRQIPALLGVSKSILDYVLFVHQEDSSWPLQEASVLKKRFDDIFDSTRYSKALESFRKTKKELMSQVKDIKAEVAELGSHKHAAKQFRQDKEQQNRNLQQLEEEMEACKRLAEESEEKFQKYFAIVGEVADINSKINSKRSERTRLESVIESQRGMLEEDMSESMSKEELEEKLKDFDQEVKKEKERKEELEQQLVGLKKDVEKLRQKEMKLNSSKGKVAAEKEAQDKRLKDQYTLMTKISQNYSLDLRQSMTQMSLEESFVDNDEGETQPLSKEDMQSFLSDLRKKESELRENLKTHKADTRNQENEISTALQDMIGNRNAYDNERTKLSEENKEIDKETRELLSVASKRTKKSSVEEARDMMVEAKKHLDELQNKDDRTKLEAEIRSCNDKLELLKEEIEAKNSAKGRLKHTAGIQAQIDIMKNQAQSEARNLHESIESKKDLLRKYDIDMPAELPDDPTIASLVPSMVQLIDSEYQKAMRQHDQANQDLDRAKTAHSNHHASHLSARNAVMQHEKRRDTLKKGTVNKIKRAVKDMTEEADFDPDWNIEKDEPQVLLDKLGEEVETLKGENSIDMDPAIISRVIKRVRKLGKRENSCPCCRRSLDGAEKNVFNDAMKELENADESKIIRRDDEVESSRKRLAALEGHRTLVYNSMTDLQEYRRILSELPDRRSNAEKAETASKKSQEDIAARKSDASKAKKIVDGLRDLYEMSKRWREDANRIEEQANNIGDKEESLNAETSTSTSVGDGTLQEVEDKLMEMQDEQANLYEKISKKNKKIASINSDVAAAQQRYNSRLDVLRRKEEKYAEEQKAAERKQFLDERKTKVTQEMSKLGEQIQSLQQKIRAKESEKARLVAHGQDEETKLSETLNQFVSDMKHLNDLNKQIEEYGNEDSDGLEQIEAEVEKIVDKIEEKQKQARSLQPQLDKAKKVVDDQERQKKLLRDNIDLLECQADLTVVQGAIEDLEKERDGVEGAATAQEKMQAAQNERNKANSKQNLLKGRHREIMDQIRGLQRKLQAPEYRNVDAEHREALIKKQTTEQAAADLEKYAGALDKALLRFHSIKIGEINKIIKELWLKCYQGNDITCIELESGQESRAAKSYNYRVVMSKGQTKMDMRGRCSAGQRVLASIVIRLALAETFGVNCGCLVLDEPTVNLDEANRNSLASAMAQIIAERSKQSNFQLVLITHDQDFISLMKDELSTQTGFSMPEKYFMVKRLEDSPGKWYSKIEGLNWDELL